MVDITRLTGGNTPANGGDPRTFPAIWNATATSLESALAEAPVTVSATAPSSPSNGDLWWDTINLGLFMYYTGGETPEWIVAGGGGGGSIEISPTAPESPSSGDMWWDSDNGNLYIYYDDGNSQQWVAANGPQVFVGTAAPAGYQGQLWFDSTTGKVYIYYDDGTSAQWVAAVGGQNIQSSDLPAGSVIQVVSTTKTDTFSASVTSGASTSITGLTATITPQSTSSKILVFAQVSGGALAYNYPFAVALTASGTKIGIGDAADSRTRIGSENSTTGANESNSVSLNYLHSPNTTLSITYGVDVINRAGSTQTQYVNRTVNDSNAVDRTRSASTITLIEVAG